MNGKKFNYFDMYILMTELSFKAAEELNYILSHYSNEKLNEKALRMHDIEHTADGYKHAIITKLAKEFKPPICREDIVELAQIIDDVTDSIEDVLLKIYMFNISELKPEALEFSNLILSCCGELKTTVCEFKNFKKSNKIKNSIVEINRLEEEGDKLYYESVKNLFDHTKDALEIIRWKEIFEAFEKCFDACEHAANKIESIIMKN